MCIRDSPYTDDMIEITLSRNIDEERRLQKEAIEKERRAKLMLEDALQKAEKAVSYTHLGHSQHQQTRESEAA